MCAARPALYDAQSHADCVPSEAAHTALIIDYRSAESQDPAGRVSTPFGCLYHK